ncbi:cobalamin B12-binding domain-containing protein [Alkalitalea saponilacus]|uniref:Methanogenic corrinoid protein MtbC1 n=1 Tax=Alkalitalea saponilacus TaxID=889453 RepID=A0A1T5E0X7_9BACT|nr:cobalamin-dependent protein [Alkalitalea saponilacus]ASB49129.1 cobalamin-binding protein [Alkalitalea saponilacus]SKB77648.1 Methanogenic corrinoid protein MtbC1 [Alkalitalea saponilacus]
MMQNRLTDDLYPGFLSALISGNREECKVIVTQLTVAGINRFVIYEAMFKRALYDVGELWEMNRISVATEHLASSITESLLNDLYATIKVKNDKKKIVIITSVEKELHQIGIRMISDLFECNGWRTFFLGANTPTTELISFAKKNKPDLIAVSLSIYMHLPVLENLLQKIKEELPGLPVLTGGQAFRHGGDETLKKYDFVYFQPDLEHTRQFIENIN